RRAQHPGPDAGPERRGHRDLAIGDLAQRPAILTRDGDRAAALLGEAGAVQNQYPAAFGYARAERPPDTVGAPGRIGNEVLERLVGSRIADALQHRTHRLAAAVAEQSQQIATKRPALRDVREADFERLEP